ncbi:MAG: DNA-directed RNA polymerase subunit alpha [Coriobacteriales bacterium]|nr:DNA-directed RNA polymerase subunit alpha [Coriobacteriales bacterium]
MTEFLKPNVKSERVDDNTYRFIMEPLERGYGYTLGNSMRRVLLNSLDGAAVSAIQIEGVQHEFTSIKGVVEDVTDIVLNIKGLVFSSNGLGNEATAKLKCEGPMTVTGADIDVPSEFELVNKEHVIATLAEGASLDMTMRIGVGRGYVSAARNAREGDPIGIIHVDSLYSPVRRCTMDVTDTRVAQQTDYDKLILEVETNGAVDPTAAVCQAANIINQYMASFMSLNEEEIDVENVESIFAVEGQAKNTELDKAVEDLDLTVRSYNCLKRAGIHTVREIVEYSESELLNIRNFGAKSIEEVKDKLQELNLSFKK